MERTPIKRDKLKAIILLSSLILVLPIIIYFTHPYREIKENLDKFYEAEFNDDMILYVYKEHPNTRDEYRCFTVGSNANCFRIELSRDHLRDSLFKEGNIVSKKKFSDVILLKADNTSYVLKFRNSSEMTFPWKIVGFLDGFMLIVLILELVSRQPIIRMP